MSAVLLLLYWAKFAKPWQEMLETKTKRQKQAQRWAKQAFR
jgi:hypothetical protein